MVLFEIKRLVKKRYSNPDRVLSLKDKGESYVEVIKKNGKSNIGDQRMGLA